jgi:hypothetical protein
MMKGRGLGNRTRALLTALWLGCVRRRIHGLLEIVGIRNGAWDHSRESIVCPLVRAMLDNDSDYYFYWLIYSGRIHVARRRI